MWEIFSYFITCRAFYSSKKKFLVINRIPTRLCQFPASTCRRPLKHRLLPPWNRINHPGTPRNSEITSCEDKSIHGSINDREVNRGDCVNEACAKKTGIHRLVRGRWRVLESKIAFVCEGYNGLTSHAEVSGSCPNGWEAYIGGDQGSPFGRPRGQLIGGGGD